jgi:hypothetical protein
MGFVSSSTVLEAKLTPIGRQKLLANNTTLITKFSLGDSDANYYCTLALANGEVPSGGGNLTASSGVTNNSVTNGVQIVNPLFSIAGSQFKNAEPNSSKTVISQENIGQRTVTGTTLSHDIVYLSANTTDTLVNLYNSFRLPITASQQLNFTNKTFNNGGWLDTALSGFAASVILVIGIPDDQYAEAIDGKEMRLTLSGTTGGTYTIYSTFQNTLNSPSESDNKFTETSQQTTIFAPNYAFIFSDQIKRPNGNPSRSWGTGFGSIKPFSAARKERYNLTTNTSLNLTADTAVGILFIDKGFVVITNPTIIADFSLTKSSATTCTYNSSVTLVNQEVVCIAGKGEFARSNNRTFTNGDTPKISEIGLYDNTNTLIAYGKTRQHITKTPNELKVFAVKISV